MEKLEQLRLLTHVEPVFQETPKTPFLETAYITLYIIIINFFKFKLIRCEWVFFTKIIIISENVRRLAINNP